MMRTIIILTSSLVTTFLVSTSLAGGGGSSPAPAPIVGPSASCPGTLFLGINVPNEGRLEMWAQPTHAVAVAGAQPTCRMDIIFLTVAGATAEPEGDLELQGGAEGQASLSFVHANGEKVHVIANPEVIGMNAFAKYFVVHGFTEEELYQPLRIETSFDVVFSLTGTRQVPLR